MSSESGESDASVEQEQRPAEEDISDELELAVESTHIESIGNAPSIPRVSEPGAEDSREEHPSGESLQDSGKGNDDKDYLEDRLQLPNPRVPGHDSPEGSISIPDDTPSIQVYKAYSWQS